MIAHLQKCITLALIASAGAWAWFALTAGRPGLAFGGALLVVFGYAGALGFEFFLLRIVHGSDPAPKPRRLQLARAWMAEALSAPRVFCWQQPFRSQRWPDHLSPGPTTSPGVLLIHGFVCNRGFWNNWIARLTGQGVPTVALTLEPAFGSIDEYVSIIEEGVRRLERSTGRAPVVVAHSMGGLAFRRWYLEQPDAQRIAHAITIGTPHHGTWLARFAFTSNGRQMRRSSQWLNTLANREDQTRAARFTCFYSHCDNIVFPPSTATLPGADNRHLEATAHVDMANHPEPWLELQAQLLTGAPGNSGPC